MGSGCVTVGRDLTIRDSKFESRHWYFLFNVISIEKTNPKRKRGREWPIEESSMKK